MKRKGMKLGVITMMTMSLLLTACSKEKTEAPAENTDKVTTITFWHAMGGALGQAIDKLVADFNSSQDKIKVEAQFQGTYDDAINKLKSSVKGNSGPDVMQVYDIGTRFMIDSGYITPMQDLIEKYNYDTSKLEPNLLSYYTVNDKLYSMPFNSSTPIFYYNKTAFKEAGLSEADIPKTFDQLTEVAGKLTKKKGDKVEQYGVTVATYGWFFEQLLVKQGGDFANNGNGRTEAATAVQFDKDGTGLKVAEAWKKLNDSGYALNVGRKTDDTNAAFGSGQAAMTLGSTSSLKDIMNLVGDKFEIGTAYFPTVDPSKEGGVSIGGASVWAMDKKDKAKEKAAFEFIKYLVSPDQQAYWSSNTGYFPVTTEAYETDAMKEHLKKFPAFQTAIDQLHASPKTATGALLGVFPEGRQAVEGNIEAMLQGTIKPEEAVKKTADTINKAIENYNKTMTR